MAEKYEVVMALLENAPGEHITTDDAGGQPPIDYLLAVGAIRPVRSAKSKGGN